MCGKIEIYFALSSRVRLQPHLAQQCCRGEDVQRSRSLLHDALLHAPFLTNNPPPCLPPSLSIPFPSLSGPWLRDRSTCRGLELKCIDLSLAGNKLIPPLFFLSLCIKKPIQCTLSFQEHACFQGLFSKRHFYKVFLESMCSYVYLDMTIKGNNEE